VAVETIKIVSRHWVPAARLPGLAPVGVVARRVVRGVLLWGGVSALMAWVLVTQFANEYPTAADRARLVKTMGQSVGSQAIFGPAHHLDTVAGYTAYHLVGFFGLIVAVWGLLAATRLLRGEEQAGRWELLLAGQTTRRRAAAGALAGLGVGLLTLWTVTAVAVVVVGRSADPSFATSASLFTAVATVATVAATAMFLAVGALCSQLAATRRRAAGLAAAVFGVAYLLRAIALSSTSLRWLRWASPLSWVDELQPLTGSRPLLLLLPILGTTAVLAALAIVLAGRRDLGASILPTTDTAPARTRLLNSPLGLAARLGRSTAAGWIAGLGAGGLIFGLTTKATADIWANQQGGVFAKLAGTTGGAIYLGLVFLIVTLLVAMAAAGQVAGTREEEAEGYLDHLLARPVARLPWLAGRFAVAAAVLVGAGAVTGLLTWVGAASTGADLRLATMLAAGINLVPAGIFVLGIGTLVHGLAPRLASMIAYGLVVWSFLVEIIGASLGASRWLMDLSLLHHLARAPAAPVRWDSAAILVAIGLAAAAIGALAFARRDLKGA
jgi:ABC-2 type transport system permease protein